MEGKMTIVFGVAVAVFLQSVAAQTGHVVGGSTGWTIPQGGAQAYVTWASANKFAVGDTFTFNFATNAHDVQEVPKASFDACSSDNAIGSAITTGPANITLTTAGEHYYICTYGRHCQSGQKLAITVSAASPGGSPSMPPPPPTNAPPTTPSPTSNDPAACAPVSSTSPSTSPEGVQPTVNNGPMSPPPPSSVVVSASFVLSFLALALLFFFRYYDEQWRDHNMYFESSGAARPLVV